MYIGLTDEQEALRQEVRAYYEELLTPEVRAKLAGAGGAHGVLDAHPPGDLPRRPRMSTFWPSSRRRGARSTSVVSQPRAFSWWARAGPAMRAPGSRAGRLTTGRYPAGTVPPRRPGTSRLDLAS